MNEIATKKALERSNKWLTESATAYSSECSLSLFQLKAEAKAFKQSNDKAKNAISVNCIALNFCRLSRDQPS